jgi:acyl-CoA thioesterase FadM
MMQDGRMLWLKKHGMTELSLHNDIGYMVSEVSVTYKSEGNYADDIEISLCISDISKRFFKLNYTLFNLTTGNKLALAATKHVFFDFSNNKIAAIPETFKSVINSNCAAT